MLRLTSSEEVPETINSVNYYLGTELKASLYKVDDVAQSESLVFMGSMNGTSFASHSSIVHTSSKSLANGESIEIEIKILFENTDSNQNVYKNFGVADGATECSRRRIIFSY